MDTVPRRRDATAKALNVLRVLADTAGDRHDVERGVRELAETLHFSPASVHRLLTMLASHGFAQQNADTGQYRIGSEFIRLALKLSSRFAIRNHGMPIMQELVARCNENAFMATYDPFRMEVMFIAGVSSNHPLQYVQPLNEWMPVHAGASGLAIMAFLPVEERRAIIAKKKLLPITPNTITDPEVLEKELAGVRRRGYAFARGQRNRGTVGLAAPIWDPDGHPFSSLILALPETRFSRKFEPTLAKLVIQHASRITKAIGGRPKD